jgi:hypothetical protein
MYERANEKINQGLSFGARVVLGIVSGFFGAIMFLAAPPSTEPRAVGFYAFGAFCLFITIACFTTGRVRQFIGSLIGTVIFLVGVAYLAAELTDGARWSDSRAGSTAFNAVRYLLFIGIPGIAYACKVRFGFRKAP